MFTWVRRVGLPGVAIVLLFVSFAVPNLVHADELPPPPPPPPLGPAVDPVSIASNNASSSLAMPGDVVTLSFTVNIVPLITPSVTIAGHDAAVLSGGGNSWTASATMLAGDTEGVVTFSAVVGSADASATTTVEDITSVPDVVFDETAPVITLTGSSSATLTVGDSFTDEGATASDAVTASVSVSVSGSVDTSSAGIYVLTYNATDDAGNVAVEVTRTVTVNAAPTPAPSAGGQGGGSGGSLYPVAPVLGVASPPAPSAPSNGEVLGAQTTNVPEHTAAGQTAPAEVAAPRAQAPLSEGSVGAAVAQARTGQTPAAKTPQAAAPDVEPQENTGTQAAASGLPDFNWWWLLLLILLALGAGYWAWRKYKEYKERKEPAL